MISRLTATAAVFAFLITAGLAVAADGHSQRSTVTAEPMAQVTLPMVMVIGHRDAAR